MALSRGRGQFGITLSAALTVIEGPLEARL